MGYNKIIVYGENFEIYEYEKSIYSSRIGRNKPRICERHVPLLGVSDNAGVIESKNREEIIKFAKRKDSARSASVAFRRLVACNLGNGEIPVLFTLTYAINQTDVRIGYRDLTSFIQSLRYKFGSEFRYVAVPEFQKRGAVHFHCLIWDFPKDILHSERQDRTIAKLWGHGFVDVYITDGNEKIAGYLAKYMSKAFLDGSLKSCKAYVGSRNLKRPNIISGIDSIGIVMDDYGVGDNPPCEDREFQSQWLGKGRFRLFKI